MPKEQNSAGSSISERVRGLVSTPNLHWPQIRLRATCGVLLRYLQSESFKIIRGDAYQIVRSLPAGKFRAIITSPPYYRHRHYGNNDHEIGREQTAEAYLDSLAVVFEACRNIINDE